MRSDPESVRRSAAQTMRCTLPAGGFQSGRESATEGTSLIIFSVRHSCMSPLSYRAAWAEKPNDRGEPY